MSDTINIDVTLRDGGYRNSFNFERSFIQRYCQAIMRSDYDWIEIGYLNGSANRRISPGVTGLSKPEYIREVADILGTAKTALIGHHHNLDKNIIRKAAVAGAGLLRLCVTPQNVTETRESIVNALDAGLCVGVNITRASSLRMDEILKCIDAIDDLPLSVVYIADSNGSMVPRDIERVINAVRKITEIPVGVHAHNHRGLALSNAVTAVHEGACWVDSSLQGMGKGAGNLIAEHWMTLGISGAPDGNDNEGQQLAGLLTASQILQNSVDGSTPIIEPLDVMTGIMDLGLEARKDFSGEIETAIAKYINTQGR